MAQASVSPVVLIILDGWGYREEKDGNAIAAAKTPLMDSLWAAYPRTLIHTSGRAAGLPDGPMGNPAARHRNPAAPRGAGALGRSAQRSESRVRPGGRGSGRADGQLRGRSLESGRRSRGSSRVG